MAYEPSVTSDTRYESHLRHPNRLPIHPAAVAGYPRGLGARWSLWARQDADRSPGAHAGAGDGSRGCSVRRAVFGDFTCPKCGVTMHTPKGGFTGHVKACGAAFDEAKFWSWFMPLPWSGC